jgi:low temperature requirement protein LtrA
MHSQAIVSPENQNVTFVELFFDLVFVFSVTQIVHLLHDGLDLTGVGQAVLVFWLVWWAWTQFTWALNAANTTHQWVELGTLLATAVAFFMAIAVPDAFHGRALWFALPYVAVRLIGLAIYVWVAWTNAKQRAAVRTFGLVSLGGLVAVMAGGIVGDGSQHWFWGLAILLDIVAAAIGGQSEDWNLHSEHFVERHGLFVIIALGETLIIAAGAVTGVELTGDLITISILAVAITCGLWWTYFTSAKQKLDDALAGCSGNTQSMMARDVFSLIHFPMLCGVIAYAVAVEEVVAHPEDPLLLEGRLALAAGMILFVVGTALAIWRATSTLMLPRIVATGAAALAIVLLADVNPTVTLAIALVGIVIVGFSEHGLAPESVEVQ